MVIIFSSKKIHRANYLDKSLQTGVVVVMDFTSCDHTKSFQSFNPFNPEFTNKLRLCRFEHTYALPSRLQEQRYYNSSNE